MTLATKKRQKRLIIKNIIMLKDYLKLLFSTLLVIFLCSCGTEEWYLYSSFHEPADEGLRFLVSRDGMHWDSIPGTWLHPEVGKQHVMRDPSILRTPDGTFHLVWTSSWQGDRGFGYANSRDLTHWSKERFITVMEDTSTVNVWAPEWFYDDERKQAMVVWASCIPYRFEKGIEDERNNHRLYYSMTKDFNTFTTGQLLMDPGFSSIDATIIKRGKSDYVMVLKDNTRPNRNLRISTAKDPLGPWSAASEPFTEEFVEGPTVVKIDNGYLIYYDRYKKYDFGASFTTNFKHFDDYSDHISIPPLHKHGTIFKAPAKIVKNLIKVSNSSSR